MENEKIDLFNTIQFKKTENYEELGTKSIDVEMTDSQYRKLDDMAKKIDTSVSDILDQFLAACLKRKDFKLNN